MNKIGKDVYVATGAVIVGDVTVGDGSSIWHNAVLRGDTNAIVVGKNTNIQDCSVVHVERHQGVVIGDNVTIGHGAIIHSCTVGNHVLIGMGSIVLDGAVIGDHCMIGVGTLITQGKEIPAGSLVFGNPGKIIRPLTEEEIQSIAKSAENYCENAKAALANLEK